MRNALAAKGMTRRLSLWAGVTVAALLAAAAASAFGIERDSRFGPEGAARTVSILSTTDTDIFLPLIEGFLARNPGLGLRYSEASSQEVYRAINDETAAYDIVISSAMDLQMKLANDGLARPVYTADGEALPDWARWREYLYAVAQEPAVLILHRDALPEGASPPRTRRDLIALLRDNPARFRGRIATYDPITSGVGYMFVTQEARMSDAFWRLAEVIGRLDARLYCCSVEMLEDLKSGRMLVGYNVLGSYAATQIGADDPLMVIELEDFTLTLLRTALVPVSAPAPDLGEAFLAFLISPEGRRLFGEAAGLPPVDTAAFARSPHLRPIPLDPGLLAHLDAMMRRQFLEEWRAALDQP